MEGQNYFSLACKFRDKPVDLTQLVCFSLGCHKKETLSLLCLFWDIQSRLDINRLFALCHSSCNIYNWNFETFKNARDTIYLILFTHNSSCDKIWMLWKNTHQWIIPLSTDSFWGFLLICGPGSSRCSGGLRLWLVLILLHSNCNSRNFFRIILAAFWFVTDVFHYIHVTLQ